MKPLTVAPFITPQLPRIEQPNPAKWAVKAIFEEIADFEASLDEDQ
jgi:hypothetical protein